jgi:cytochrome c oxidase subunit 2
VAATDLTILVSYAVAVLLSVGITLGIWASTRTRRPTDTHRLAEFERRWLVIVVVILVALLAATIWLAPYGHSTPANAQVVRVEARQFFWQITPARVKVDRPVAFVTRATDVNHGFGVYRGHTFIAQIQVVPGRSSTLVRTFHHTGTYTVLCLEFCGVGHHDMRSTFEVIP